MPSLTLTLQGFRRFTNAQFQFPHSTLLVGPNGVGKSTILEAFHYLAVGRSHRTARERDLLGWGADVTHAEVAFSNTLNLKRSLVATPTTLEKRVQRNGVSITPLASLGLFHVVLFAPEQLDLVVGPPRNRRRYLDILLASTDQEYAHALAEYAHALRARNTLLAHPSQSAALEPWETLLSQRGRIILTKRQGVVQYLGDLLPQFYTALSPDRPQRAISLLYSPTINNLDHYDEQLVASRDRDRRLRATTLGPHRDDLRILFDRYDAAAASSRGEQRSFLLALKRAELEFFMSVEADVPPLLLLDDMFSELDEARAAALADLLGDHHAVLTTTDATSIPASVRRKIDITQMANAREVVV